MKLQMIGCSHHDAAVEFRERVAFSGEALAEALHRFRQRFPTCELVLLSTCNRVELYTTANDEEQLNRQDVVKFLADERQLAMETVFDQMIYRSDEAAVEHLFTVAASLDSMVVGEAQILSQVKQAYDFACSQGSAGPLTHSVFQAANRAAKRVQQETQISKRRVSVPSVAVGEIIPEVFDSLGNKRVVICGAGEMASETLRYLKDAGAKDIRILNRRYERAVELAESIGGRAERWESLAEQLVAADVMIGTTSSEEPILDAATFESIATKRQNRVLLILDLAVPRDVDPAVGQFEGVYLYSIDDLRAACDRNRRQREREWPKAKAIISEETQRFMQSIRHRATGPVIARLREQAEDLKRDELQRLIGKLKLTDADPALQKEIEKSFDRLINKLLHPPLTSVRDDAAEGHSRGLVEALKHLFNLGE
jgi:glutamyl-tRNA reductase